MSAVLCVGAGVLLFYVNRLFAELPLYPGDEGAYLIRALYAQELAAYPLSYRGVQPVANTLYFAIIQLVDALSLNVIQWMRLIGALSYFGGLLLLYAIAVRECGRKVALGFLLIAAAFPYYRFAFSAMPDGVYVGLLCLIVFVLYWTYHSRPLLSAALVGGLAAALMLVKPQGVVVAPAFLALCLVELVLNRRSLGSILGRLGLFAIAFLIVGASIELLAGRPVVRAATFFLGSAYADHLGREPGLHAFGIAGLSAASMLSLSAIFVSVPLAAAALGFLRNRDALKPADLALWFVILCMAGTIAMVTIFSFKMSGIEVETRRLWGRYFEFFTPMLWLLAARPLTAWDISATARSRAVAAGGLLIGLGGMFGVFAFGVRLFAWDGTAITAFSHPDTLQFPFGYVGGSRLVASFATIMVAVATLARVPVRATWPAYFVVLGLLSTRADDAWAGENAGRARAIEHELHVAAALTLEQGGPTVVIVPDGNDGHVAYLRLNGQADFRSTPVGPIKERPLMDYDNAIVFGDRAPGKAWRKVYGGRQVAAYVREAPEE